MTAAQTYVGETPDAHQDGLDVHGQGQSLSAQVGRHARQFPEARAVTFKGADLTYAALHDRGGRLARVLAEQGVRPGDRVAILLHNRLEYVEALVAASRLGAIAVPLNFRLSVAELAFQLTDSGAVVVLTEDALAGRVAEAAGSVATLVAGPAYEESLTRAETFPETRVDEDAAAVIMYTSGTTGKPKGAMLSHRSLHAWASSRQAHLGFPSYCRNLLCATPLFHIAGLATALSAAYVGGRLVLHPTGAFDAGELIDVLDREQVNLAFFVPSQWQAIVRHPAIQGRTFPHFTFASWGGSPASAALVREILAAFPTLRLTTSFGQTEICSTGTVLMAEDAVERPDSVGKAVIGVEHRLVDAEMNDVGPGEVGEIVYRGPTVMLGYWNRPEETAEAFRGGWFHSGDLLRRDEDGFLYVVDRIKDMIISGGENIYCAEVENVLAGHPDVGTVAVVGAPDEKWGEVPVAVVVPRGGPARPAEELAEELTAYARRYLAAYKVPKRFTVLEAMPMNASGKIRKNELRTLVRDEP